MKGALNFSDHVTRDIGDREVYRSAEEFHDVNSACCVLHRWGHADLQDGLWVRAFGCYIAVAEIWYRLNTKAALRIVFCNCVDDGMRRNQGYSGPGGSALAR